MINAGTHGAVTWIDLSTPDVKAAAEFYQELLGGATSKCPRPRWATTTSGWSTTARSAD